MIKAFFLANILFFSPLSLLAHGEFHPPAKAGKITAEPRSTAAKPSLLEALTIQSILDAGKVPPDVLLIRCSFTEFTPCRGIPVSLSDTEGSRILIGNSGTNGWIGFQGLSTKVEYKVKLASEKYAGEFSVESGVVAGLAPVRILN